MVKIICDTEKEKNELKRLLRFGVFVAMGADVIFKTSVKCFDYRKIHWEVRKK